MYRGKDSKGELQGGPMYVIEQGLGKRWKPLAVFFSIAGLIGVSPIFQANQLTKIITDVMIEDAGITSSLVIGIFISILVGIVIFGGIKRIGKVAGKLVPVMVLLYAVAVITILITYHENIPETFALIISDAFTGKAVLGGALGTIILIGAKRAAFSNEAGIGTAPMAHGAAQTNEPIREGLVAMLGPIIDTIIVCSMTAFTIIVTGVWQTSEANGVTLTLHAFEMGIPYVGKYILIICVAIFSLTTLFAFPYYGSKCLSYLIGAERKHWYNYFFLIAIVLGSVSSLGVIVNLIDSMYALMAFPTMIAALILAPKVKKAAKEYMKKLEESKKRNKK